MKILLSIALPFMLCAPCYAQSERIELEGSSTPEGAGEHCKSLVVWLPTASPMSYVFPTDPSFGKPTDSGMYACKDSADRIGYHAQAVIYPDPEGLMPCVRHDLSVYSRAVSCVAGDRVGFVCLRRTAPPEYVPNSFSAIDTCVRTGNLKSGVEVVN